MQLGKPDKAKERYQAALEQQPNFPDAKANLALAEKLLEEQQQQSKNDQQNKTKVNKGINKTRQTMASNNRMINNQAVKHHRSNSSLTKTNLSKINQSKQNKDLKSNRIMPTRIKILSSKKRMNNRQNKRS